MAVDFPADRRVADHRLSGADLSGRAADGLSGARAAVPDSPFDQAAGSGARHRKPVGKHGYRCIECSPWVDVRDLVRRPGRVLVLTFGSAWPPEESCCNVETCCCWQRPRLAADPSSWRGHGGRAPTINGFKNVVVIYEENDSFR